MTGDLISREAKSEREKIVTHFARIVVGGLVEKPYYAILWYDPTDEEYHEGYGSYFLGNVVQWLSEDFEIVGNGFTNEPMVHGRWIDGRGSWSTSNCSVCGWKIPYSEDAYLGYTKYCPNCGAKMDKEVDDALD